MNKQNFLALKGSDWLLTKVGFFSDVTFIKERDGLIWVCDTNDRIAVVDEQRAGRYRHGIMRRCRKMTHRKYLNNGRIKIKKDDLILNVGANIGEVAMYLADCGAKVLAFEPDPIARNCLELNTKRKSVEIFSYGIWNTTGDLRFYLATENADSSAINQTDKHILIKVKTIDDVVNEKNIKHIRLIAGDAEGGEPEVLQGAKNALKLTDYVCLDCSYERNGAQTRDVCADILSDAGFKILKSSSKKHLVARRTVA